MSLPSKNKFDPTLPIDTAGNKPSQNFRDYMSKLDALLNAIVAGNGNLFPKAANDAAAAKVNVPVGGFYVNNGVVQQRQS